MNESGIEKIGTVTINEHDELYKVVDLLNKSLKDRNLMFGLAMDQEEDGKMRFSIYET